MTNERIAAMSSSLSTFASTRSPGDFLAALSSSDDVQANVIALNLEAHGLLGSTPADAPWGPLSPARLAQHARHGKAIRVLVRGVDVTDLLYYADDTPGSRIVVTYRLDAQGQKHVDDVTGVIAFDVIEGDDFEFAIAEGRPELKPMRHTPIVLAEAIVKLLDEAGATSGESFAALDIARTVIGQALAFTIRDDAASDAEHAARDAARDAARAAASNLLPGASWTVISSNLELAKEQVDAIVELAFERMVEALEDGRDVTRVRRALGLTS